jgi:hypothetical protein
MLEAIVNAAINQNKNILIMGSARSGTHALGTMLANDNYFKYNGEICRMDITRDLFAELDLLCDHSTTSVSQIVQYIPKIKISKDIDKIKNHVIIVNLRRKNKIKQFASWIYFSRYHDISKGWHSQVIDEEYSAKNQFTITNDDIELFLAEQMIDDFFKPDYSLFYEDLTFKTATTKENIYKFDITKIFSNLDFVKEKLENWKYPK